MDDAIRVFVYLMCKSANLPFTGNGITYSQAGFLNTYVRIFTPIILNDLLYEDVKGGNLF